MPETAETQSLELLANEVFALTQMGWTGRGHARRRSEQDISDSEYRSLDALARLESMTVGELQKRVGVFPAQMSRIIRSLENKPDEPMIACAINPDDKRKIDVSITDAGRKAVAAYRSTRLAGIVDALAGLSAADRTDLVRILRLIKNRRGPDA